MKSISGTVKKKIAIIVFLLLVLILIASVFLWYFMGKPLYRPGMVRMGENLRAPLTPPRQPDDENFWTVEKDIRLYHYSDGVDKNVLVIHGGPGYPINEPLPGLKPLTDNYRFIYYDQRGCGKSTRPVSSFSSSNYYRNMTTLDKTLGIGAQVADIERIRRITGEEKLVIFGHSFGAFLASMYAAEFPENVKAMILVSPANVLVMPVEGGDLFETIERRLPKELKNEYAQFLKEYFDFGRIFSKTETDLVSLNSKFAKYYAAAYKSLSLSIPTQDQLAGAGGWMVQAMYFSMGKRHDYRKSLKNVKAPVLVIHGENDLQPEKASRTYTDCFPNSKFHVIKNAGHFSFSERPDEFSITIGKFLDEMK
jgi:proline iminopeptidase